MERPEAMKKKLNEAIELLTQLRVDLIDSDRESLERKAYDIEMKICEAFDLKEDHEREMEEMVHIADNLKTLVERQARLLD